MQFEHQETKKINNDFESTLLEIETRNQSLIKKSNPKNSNQIN